MLEIAPITIESWTQYEKDILSLEAMAFSAAQCHPVSFYLNMLNNERSLCYIALVNGEPSGFLFSAALELFEDTKGVLDDPYFGEGIVLYTADMVVNPQFRKQGIGKALKTQQLAEAKSQGYRVVAGRNRLKYADAMWRINQSLGAKVVRHLTGIYKDGRLPNECIYHHLAL